MPTDIARKAGIRDRQRWSRANRKKRIEDGERRLKEYESNGAKVNPEIEEAAWRALKTNRRLWQIVTLHGLDAGAEENLQQVCGLTYFSTQLQESMVQRSWDEEALQLQPPWGEELLRRRHEGKRKTRKNLTDEQRRAVCQIHEQDPSTSRAVTADIFDVDRSTIRSILKNKKVYLQQQGASHSWAKSSNGEDMELLDYFRGFGKGLEVAYSSSSSPSASSAALPTLLTPSLSSSLSYYSWGMNGLGRGFEMGTGMGMGMEIGMEMVMDENGRRYEYEEGHIHTFADRMLIEDGNLSCSAATTAHIGSFQEIPELGLDMEYNWPS
ncbi:hypothetical protein VE04_02101 [Pseudogymnoascus sp. 24MN13]|nr:hypothetical protein VE04_02101 [Pseudogymnoascus sp. 24MN13]